MLRDHDRCGLIVAHCIDDLVCDGGTRISLNLLGRCLVSLLYIDCQVAVLRAFAVIACFVRKFRAKLVCVIVIAI